MGTNPIGGGPPTGIVRTAGVFGAKKVFGGLLGAVLAGADEAIAGAEAALLGDGSAE
jgi:hypothetical protein